MPERIQFGLLGTDLLYILLGFLPIDEIVKMGIKLDMRLELHILEVSTGIFNQLIG